jgi:DeoR family deoxyribose operon repressor
MMLRRTARGLYCSGTRSANHYLISDQKSRLVDEKRRAAQLAASLVQAHQTIFFDCGTTTPWIIEAIDNELPFTAICYSLNTFLVLQEKPQCRVILCGGEFHASNAIFKPLDFQETLNNLCPDIAFIRGRRSYRERRDLF